MELTSNDFSRSPIEVSLRIKPIDPSVGEVSSLFLDSSSPQTLYLSDPSKPFTFDHIFPESATQSVLFEVVAQPMISTCLQGYNVCIFAYGQTGAGKTYTIMGHNDSIEQKGLIPRTIDYLFSKISEEIEINMTVKVSFLEIYNEQIIDLLDSSKKEKGGLLLREDLKKGVYVENLTEELTKDASEAEALLKKGSRIRHIGATNMNRESSRSHSVFTMLIETKRTINGILCVRNSKLSFVDLAGSERQKNLIVVSGDRLKEGCNINRSLHVLGKVINGLSDGKTRHIHYRDSKLTFLLKDSLGGNSKTSLIANINPAQTYYQETVSTIKFAKRAKMIRNRAFINEENSGDMESLRQEVRRLRQELVDFPRLSDDSVRPETSAWRKFVESSLEIQQNLQEELAKSVENNKMNLEKLDEFKGIEEEYRMVIELLQERFRRKQGSLSIDNLIAKENETLRSLTKRMPFLIKLHQENLRLKEEMAFFSEPRNLQEVIINQLGRNQVIMKDLMKIVEKTEIFTGSGNESTAKNDELIKLESEYKEKIELLNLELMGGNKLAEIQENLELAYEKIGALEIELEETRHGNVENMEEIERLKKRIKELENENEKQPELCGEIREITDEGDQKEEIEGFKGINEGKIIEDLKRELQEKMKDSENLKKEIDRKNEEIMKNNDFLNVKTKEQEEKNRIKEKKIEELERLLKDLGEKMNEKEVILKKFQDEQNKEKELNDLLEEKSKENEKIQEKCDFLDKENNDLLRKISDLNQQMSQIREENEQKLHGFQLEIQALKEETKEIPIMESNIAGLIEKNNNIEQEIITINQRNLDQQSQLEALTLKNIELEKEICQKIEEINQKNNLIDQKNEENERLFQQVNDLTSEISVLTKENNDFHSQIQQIFGKYTKSLEQSENLKSINENSKLEMEKILFQKNKFIEELNLRLKNELLEKEELISELQQQNKEKDEQLIENSVDIHSLESDINSLKEAQNHLEILVDEKSSELIFQNEKLANLQISHGVLQKSFGALQEKLSVVQDEYKTLLKRNQELCSKQKSSESELESSTDHIKSLEKSNEDLLKTVNSLTIDIGLSSEKFEALQKAHEALQSRFDSMEQGFLRKTTRLQKDLEIKAGNSQELIRKIEVLKEENEKAKKRFEKQIEELGIKHSEEVKHLYDERRQYLEKLIKEKDELNEEEIEKYKKLIGNLKKQNEVLEKELENKDEFSKKSQARIYKENERLKEQLDHLQKEKEKISKELSETTEMIKDFENLREAHQDQEQELNSLRKECSKLKEHYSEIEKNKRGSAFNGELKQELERKNQTLKGFTECIGKLSNIICLNGFQKYQNFTGPKGTLQEFESLIHVIQYLISGALEKENKIKEKEREIDSKNLKYSIMEREYLLQKQKLHILQHSERRREHATISVEKSGQNTQKSSTETIEKIALRERGNSMSRFSSGIILKKN